MVAVLRTGGEAKGSSSRAAAGADSASRRVFTFTREGARALADTKAMRERLWAGVRIRAVPRTS